MWQGMGNVKHPHKLSTYKEGWQRIEFCTICGEEGIDLGEECTPSKEQDAIQLELFSEVSPKKVDNY